MGATVAAVDVLRVTVVRGSRRVDVAVAAGVPVVELLPDLTRTLRGEEGRCLLATVLGRPLDPSSGLAAQQVVDGQVLTLLRTDEGPRVRHDDVADAVLRIGAEEFTRWGGRHSRTAAVLIAVLAAVTAGVVAGRAPGVAATVVCAAFAVAATVALALAVRRRGASAWVAGAVGAWHTALVGASMSPHTEGPWWSLETGTAPTVTGVGALLVLWGLVLLVVLPTRREWCVVPLAVGAVGTLSGAVATVLDVAPGSVLWLMATGALLLHRLLPAAVVDALLVKDQPGPIDPAGLRTDLGVAHRLLVSSAVVVVVVCAVVVPHAVGRGGWGIAWVLAVATALGLRARHEALRDHVVVVLGGATVIAAGAAVAAIGHGPWVLVACAVMAAAAAVHVVPWPVRPAGSRWGWVGDQVERCAVGLLLPLWLVACGVVASPAGWFG